MRTIAALAAVLALAPAAAHSNDPPRIAITIYNNDLALVEETRTVTLTGGRQRVEFDGVSGQIRPETVALSAAGVSVVEQNFDYDLLTPAALMQKAVGQQVQIVRINPGTGAEVRETATILSANDGVVLQVGERIEVLRDDGVPTRVVFPRVPPNLRPRPTLSVTVNTAQAGTRDVRLSYLTRGLSWRADYVAVFDDQAGVMDLQGWITLSNRSGTTYQNADALLVAGGVNVSEGYDQWRQHQQQQQVAAAGTQGRTVSGADFYTYPIAQRVTIANNQTKQVGFLRANNVTTRRAYVYEASNFFTAQAINARVQIRFSTGDAGGVGAQMPAGVMRIYMRASNGEPRFIGENFMSNLPQGSDVGIYIGTAFDVTVQPTVESSAVPNPGHRIVTMAYRVRNARAVPVVVEITQSGLGQNARVTDESQPGEVLDAFSRRWMVNVPANGETVLRFTSESRAG